jgi:hypothetical protein
MSFTITTLVRAKMTDQTTGELRYVVFMCGDNPTPEDVELFAEFNDYAVPDWYEVVAYTPAGGIEITRHYLRS